MENNSLKEYYIKLHTLYNNAVNMLTAINQSLTTNASQVSVELYDDNTATTVKIPSFLYLDNKLEQLETSFNNLFNMPNSGEAWFNNDGNMHKLEMVRTNTAPLRPDIDVTNLTAGFSSNKFIKDLVSPRTYFKVNISNLPNNIKQMYMKKIVLLNTTLYNELSKLNINTYEEYVAALYNYNKGIDYEEYDTTLDLPIKVDKYNSSFKISSIVDNTYFDENNNALYKLRLDTFNYTSKEDLSQSYTLNIGDYLTIGNEYAIYKIIDIDYTLMEVTLSEVVGHVALQTFDENSDMIFQLYNYNYDEYNYIEVPLEENPHIIVFLGTIYNGIRSQLSNAILLDLNNIYMINEDGSYMKDSYGNNITYIDYYNKYCNNIGDLILGLTQSAYPQLSNYNAYQLKQLQESDEIAKYVSGTVNTEGTLTVLPINTHIYDDTTIDNIKNYHSQKTSLQSELNTLTENINNVNNTLLTTDWSQETIETQSDLQSKLQQYYSERLTIEKQYNAIVNEINNLTSEKAVGNSTKYRVRGVTNVLELEEYIKSITNSKVNIIGLDVEYKYKSVSKNTTSITNINNNIFTDWNRLSNIDRQRKLVFNDATNGFTVEFVNYDTSANIIKWNQIDIPITVNEDVVIRVRYKYNIGQPFINIYSPWSEELTVSFPTEYVDNVELAKIVSVNDDDVVSSKFTAKLINDGYEEHIVNKMVVNNQTFFHMPENIYSGFNTSENNYISLKDKLNSMCNDIDTYKELVQTENQKKLAVYLQYDSKMIELHTGTTNKINIYNIDHISDYFIKKEMNIIIKNTGSVPINLYSIFPGNTDIPLLNTTYESYVDNIENYYRVPIFANDVVQSQTLGQWIYFRETNIYTCESCLYNSYRQKQQDYKNVDTYKTLVDIDCANQIFSKDNIQVGLANKYNKSKIDFSNTNYLGFISSTGVKEYEITIDSGADYDINKFFYVENNNTLNKVIYKYEDICGYLKTGSSTKVYLTSDTPISQFTKTSGKVDTKNYMLTDIESFDGAFLFVNVNNTSELLTDGTERGNVEIKVGESISVPIVFEYFLSQKQQITKRLMFDIKKSLIETPLNYIFELTANYDSSLEANIDNVHTTVISDEATQF